MEAHITGGVRTAIGRFNGSLASLDAIDLGSAVLVVSGEKMREMNPPSVGVQDQGPVNGGYRSCVHGSRPHQRL